MGCWLRESRRGRTGHDATRRSWCAGTAGFGFRAGEVWGVHVAWSGNHRSRAPSAPPAATHGSAAASCCCPARSCSPPGEATRRRGLYAAYGAAGLDATRPRGSTTTCGPGRATRAAPGRSSLNTWEAVYFDHDLDRLTRARRRSPPRSGVERFVLDDGWFRAPARRHRRPRRLVRRRARLAATGCTRWSTTCAASAWSSGCGSSRRWSTPTPTSSGPTPTGSSPPAAGRRRAGAAPAGARPRPARRRTTTCCERLDALLHRVPDRAT